MEKVDEFYGVYFMKGAFYFDVKEVGEDLVANVIHSKGCKTVHVINGSYATLKELLKSKQGEEAQQQIDNQVFDFIIVGNGSSVNYYINTDKGLKKCEATYIQ